MFATNYNMTKKKKEQPNKRLGLIACTPFSYFCRGSGVQEK
jgi:hypothetical protein